MSLALQFRKGKEKQDNFPEELKLKQIIYYSYSFFKLDFFLNCNVYQL